MNPLGNKKTILVIEDDQDVLQMIVRHLEHLDYEVISARDGMEGLKKLETGGYDMVITDIVISIDSFGDFNDPFLAVFWKMKDGSESRYLDIAGKYGPFSHPFSTPLVLQEGYSLGAASEGNKIQIILTGYLQSVAE